MKWKQIMAGLLSAAVVLGNVPAPILAADNTETVFTGSELQETADDSENESGEESSEVLDGDFELSDESDIFHSEGDSEILKETANSEVSEAEAEETEIFLENESEENDSVENDALTLYGEDENREKVKLFQKGRHLIVKGFSEDIGRATAVIRNTEDNESEDLSGIIAEDIPLTNKRLELPKDLINGTSYKVLISVEGTVIAEGNFVYQDSAYVLMNIPYSVFYGTQNIDGVDAVTSSTYNKPRTGALAGGSYHVNADGSDISGVIYPVKVNSLNLLDGYKEVTDEDSVTIEVTNRGQKNTTTYKGKCKFRFIGSLIPLATDHRFRS